MQDYPKYFKGIEETIEKQRIWTEDLIDLGNSLEDSFPENIAYLLKENLSPHIKVHIRLLNNFEDDLLSWKSNPENISLQKNIYKSFKEVRSQAKKMYDYSTKIEEQIKIMESFLNFKEEYHFSNN